MNTTRHDPRFATLCVGLTILAAVTVGAPGRAQTSTGYLPDEAAPHEGTWLEWPHHHTYGLTYRNRLDATWVDMTRALVASEKVHVIAYDSTERTRITALLTAGSVPHTDVDFLLRANDDCWVRDNGPIFVRGAGGQLAITDWGFNGWGLDTPYTLDDTVPVAVANGTGIPRINLSTTVLEGGSIEVDGSGVLIATRSSILEPNRNPGLTQAQLESALRTNLGVTKFIWLNGAPGGQLDITDMHIDGFVHFAPARTIVTMSTADLVYWGLSAVDISTLQSATDLNGTPYSFVQLPLTAGNVVTTYGFNIGYKGSYVNYYVGNTVVLLPTYNDANDGLALSILQQLYPSRTVVGIDVRNLYRDGGMVHCVTQQQPAQLPPVTASFCAGDGVGTACPCGNNSAPSNAEGCLNSLGSGGKLLGTGTASVSADTLVLAGTQMPDSSVLYFQGTAQQSGGAGSVFGDGLRCASGAVIRLGTKFNVSGASQYPSAGDPSISIRGADVVGNTRTYQCWYRNAASFCTSSTFNLTNGAQTTWLP